VSRLQRWFEEDPPRSPAEYACELARDRFWREEQARLIGVHPDFPDVTYLLGLGEEIAHALILILSRIPADQQLPFAEVFFDERRGGYEVRAASDFGRRLDAALRSAPSRNLRLRLAAGAELALLVVDLAATDALRDELIIDLLRGAAQGDDLTLTSAPAVELLRKTIARVRLDPAVEDNADPRAVAAHAIVEVLDPSSEVVAVKEVLARAAYATVECRERSAALGFLFEADRILADESQG
jgi:hypothetical protein